MVTLSFSTCVSIPYIADENRALSDLNDRNNQDFSAEPLLSLANSKVRSPTCQ